MHSGLISLLSVYRKNTEQAVKKQLGSVSARDRTWCVISLRKERTHGNFMKQQKKYFKCKHNLSHLQLVKLHVRCVWCYKALCNILTMYVRAYNPNRSVQIEEMCLTDAF